MPDPTPEAAAPQAAAGSAGVNAQVIDAVTAAHTLLVGSTPPTSFAMLDLALTQTLGMAMQTMVQRQQEAATLAMAAVNAACARIAATGHAAPGLAAMPPFPPAPFVPSGPVAPPAPSQAELVATATAEAKTAVDVLLTIQQSADLAVAKAATDALAAISSLAANPPEPPNPSPPPPYTPAPPTDKE